MVFTSVEFLVFFAITMGSLIFFQDEGKRTVLVVASAVFYGFWDWRFLSLLYFSVGFNFFIYRMLISEETDVSRKYLRIGVVVNLLVLGFFKYYNFFLYSLYDLLEWSRMDLSHYAPLRLILPVGISFFTFQAISFLIDTFRGQVVKNVSLKELALYITLFPQLVAGPIVRANRILPLIRNPLIVDESSFIKGWSQIVWGFFLKLCVANNAAPIADVAFDNAFTVNSSQSLIGVLAFTAQIFGDFAGYSLIAIGIGTLLGYEFGVNFRNPYKAQSFSDFWQRWHISLSSWLRDYLYIPLGGNRGSSLATYRNLSITMFLGGLWHGASYNFIIWGILHGTFLCVERVFGIHQVLAIRPRSVLTWCLRRSYGGVVFTGVVFSWIFFRASDFSISMEIIESICRVSLFSFFMDLAKTEYMRLFTPLLIYYILQRAGVSARLEGLDVPFQPSIAVFLLSILIVGIITLGNFNGQTFIYFQF